MIIINVLLYELKILLYKNYYNGYFNINYNIE